MNYQNGKIYCIRSHQTDQIYIGSTSSPLSKRFYEHKHGYKNYLNNKFCYISSFDIIKYDDCYIELIEEFPCDNKLELTKREGELIRSNTCVNKVIPGRTQKEYREDNKEKIAEQQKEYKKEYREINKDKIAEIRNKKTECECGSHYTYTHKLRHFKSKRHLNFIQISVPQEKEA